MNTYDDAVWHYEEVYSAGLPPENASTHIGIFLTWCILNNQTSDGLNEDFEDDILLVKSRELTGGDFLINNLTERLLSADLTDAGNGFAADYYRSGNGDSEFTKQFSGYINDYKRILAPTIRNGNAYKVENSWSNYDMISVVIDQRFQEWKQYSKKQNSQFR
ncbi:hypothetical protein [Chitinophaga sp. S165]|uniref:DUF7832 domain-containing protein n=1 Tax=Chitinophaga sp. S165 TaxID=2135462 RepID=UPI000D70FD90|nr:hypothetical protein [Chitinophaga sp. S165]PWV53507.1 hypothetical protein C7475_102255 [Chitinophaga sp. S165]